MKTIDLFSGVGGLSLGFELAGFTNSLAIEYDPRIAMGYRENFKDSNVIVDDINNIDLNKMLSKLSGDDYVLIGGPPCQGFSQKGKRNGLNDERNFMFLKYVEAVEYLNPRAFLIENVPGLLTVENGYFLNEIAKRLQNLGYLISHQVLDAVDYGVPQNRKRAFIVGVKNNERIFKWPEKVSPTVNVEESLSDLPILKSGEGNCEMEYRTPPMSEYQSLMRRNSNVVWNHISTKHSNIVLERLNLIPEDGGRKDLPAEHLTKSIFSGTWCRLSKTGVSRTITTRFDTPSSGMFTLPNQNRCLTVREAARLQSFPDNFIFTGTKSTQMLQVGNAVPPLLSYAVAKQIRNLLY